MPAYTPACIASDGYRLFLVSLTSADGTPSPNPSLSVNPTQTAFTRRLVLLQSQSGPASLSAITWSFVSTFPPVVSSDNNGDNNNDDSSSGFVNSLDLLVGDFNSGTSVCQVDGLGNFVWLTSQSAVKTSDSPLTSRVSPSAKGIQYVTSSGTGGTWSIVNATRLDGTDYIWSANNKVNALFSIAPGVFVHALASTKSSNITLGLLTAGGSLVQANQAWQPPNVGSSPKALLLSSKSLLVLGANNNLTILPFSQTVRDVQSLMNFQQTVTAAQTTTMVLKNVPAGCTSSTSTGVYAATANDNFFLLCSSNNITLTSQLVAYNETDLGSPVTLPTMPTNMGNLTSFVAVTSLSDAPGGNAVLAVAVNSSLFGAKSNAKGLQIENGAFQMINNSSLTPSTNSGTDSTKNSNTGSIAGSVVSVIAVLLIVFWCRYRRRQKPTRIAKIFQKNDHVPPVSPGEPGPTELQTPGLQPLQPYYAPIAPLPLVQSEEEQDQAHIEMIRMQLPPAPPSVSSSGPGSVGRPLAPPSVVENSDYLHDYHSQPYAPGSPSSTSGLLPQTQGASSSSGYHNQHHQHDDDYDEDGDHIYDKKKKRESISGSDHGSGGLSSLAPPPPPYSSIGSTSSIKAPSAPPLSLQN